jgi:hypothetical protein
MFYDLVFFHSPLICMGFQRIPPFVMDSNGFPWNVLIVLLIFKGFVLVKILVLLVKFIKTHTKQHPRMSQKWALFLTLKPLGVIKLQESILTGFLTSAALPYISHHIPPPHPSHTNPSHPIPSHPTPPHPIPSQMGLSNLSEFTRKSYVWQKPHDFH